MIVLLYYEHNFFVACVTASILDVPSIAGNYLIPGPQCTIGLRDDSTIGPIDLDGTSNLPSPIRVNNLGY